MRIVWLLLSLVSVLPLCAIGACAVQSSVDRPLPPKASSQDYIKATKGRATLVPSGTFTMEGSSLSCGGMPLVLDPGFNDYGASFPKFLIFNPRLLAKEAPSVQLWIFQHECGHHHVGKDEAKADCYGVKQGRREGWLDAKGLDQICAFIQPGRADSAHFSGAERCAAMRQCYASAPR